MEFAESFGAIDAIKVSNSKFSEQKKENETGFGNIEESHAEMSVG